MSNLKVEGKAHDWCPKCMNCTGCNHIGTYICEDPYDGLKKDLSSDDDILCSMFEPKPDISHISRLEHELEMDKLRRKIHELEKEKAAHMKGIERLKKSQEKLQNQIKNLQITNEESYKREEELEDKVHKLERRLHGELERGRSIDTNFLMPLTRVLYPGEKVGKPYSEVLEDIKNLKIQSDENGIMYEEIKKLRAKNQAYFNEISDRLAKHTDQCDEITKLKNENMKLRFTLGEKTEDLHKLADNYDELKSKVEVLDKRNSNQSVMLGEKDKEIENLKEKNRELQIRVNDLLFQEKLNKSAFGYDYEEENGKLRVENEQLRNKNEKYLKKITDQQARDYKRISRIVELEFAVNKLQSGEYDDILAKDIEIKSLQAKYEEAMDGWNHTVESYDKLQSDIDELTKTNDKLAKMVERRDKWVEELKSDVDTLQNECLSIAEIAKRAYDETNRD